MQFERDKHLATQHQIKFTVFGTPKRFSCTGLRQMPERQGTFLDPEAAVKFARSFDEHGAMVLVDELDIYWSSDEPRRINSDVLTSLCTVVAIDSVATQDKSSKRLTAPV